MNQENNFSLSEKGPTFGPKINGVVINGALDKDVYVRLGFLRLNKNEAYLKNPNRSLATTILDKIFAPKPYEASKAQKKKRYIQHAVQENPMAANYESNNYYSTSKQSFDGNPIYQREYYEQPDYYNYDRAYTPNREDSQEIAYQKISPYKSSPEERVPSKKVEFDSSSAKKTAAKAEHRERPPFTTSTSQQGQRGRVSAGAK